MRTTVNLDDDVAAAVERLRKERGIGLSSALDELARRGPAQGEIPRSRFLAAPAIEHGVGVCSADTDFARFTGLKWINPLTG